MSDKITADVVVSIVWDYDSGSMNEPGRCEACNFTMGMLLDEFNPRSRQPTYSWRNYCTVSVRVNEDKPFTFILCEDDAEWQTISSYVGDIIS